METSKQIQTFLSLIESIKYKNEHGGAYAYVQFMAYSRDLTSLLRVRKHFEKQIEAIEAINWLFNEYLAVRFTFRHQVIFENKLSDLKPIFESIRETLILKKTNNYYIEHQSQAA